MKDGKVQPLEGRDRKKIQEAIETMSGRALRVLAGPWRRGDESRQRKIFFSLEWRE